MSEEAWVACGAAALTGRAGGPGLVPAVDVLHRIGELLSTAPVADPWRLLTDRAGLRGGSRSSPATVGGPGRLVATADGWVAVNLPRPEDRASVAAWLELAEDPGDDPWPAIRAAAAGRPGAELVERAGLLGLAVAVLPSGPPAADGIVCGRMAPSAPLERPPRVVDLSALWAGPLCADLLRRRGAEVVKVESSTRPDGARADGSGFFHLLNGGKASVVLDLSTSAGVGALAALVATADVVVESARPRALAQLGIDADGLLAAGGPRVWVSITGHGRAAAPDRIGFGDDAAVAGGLVVGDGDGPCFVADAVADPLTGVAAAAAVQQCLTEGGRWLVDAALASVAASVVGSGAAERGAAGEVADPPRPVAPVIEREARPLGADTDRILADLP